MLLINPEKMRTYEEQANSSGYSFEDMMHTAGAALAQEVERRWHGLPSKKVTGLIGGGKNGGDTLIALTALHQLGWQTTAIALSASLQPDWISAAYLQTGAPLLAIEEGNRCASLIADSAIVLDGILGTGFIPPMRADLAEKMKRVRKWCKGKTVVAVDCPSGVDCATGNADENTLVASLTVCMEGVKSGLMAFPAFDFVGEICTVDVGILKHLRQNSEEEDVVLDAELVTRLLPPRPRQSHKGSFGTVLVCGGSANYPGAPVFTGHAAYRAGAGLVRIAVPERIYPIVAGQCLEATWLVLDDERGVIAEPAAILLQKGLERSACLAIGPGLGTEETTFRFFNEFLTAGGGDRKTGSIGFIPTDTQTRPGSVHLPPLVLDADGLRLLARISNWDQMLKLDAVFTPHPGEMSTLTGLPVSEILDNRIEICRMFAQKWQQVVVLKGSLTVIAAPTGKVAICPIASSALAKAGSGDVLTGLIAGLIAQGMAPFEAALAGVWIHASAGLLAAEKLGSEYSVGISDILDGIPQVFAALNKK